MKTSTHCPEPLEARIAPASFRWDSPGGGNWNDQNNWFNETLGVPDNGFPNAMDDVAKFTTANAAGAIVNINGVNVTAGALVFDDDSIYQISSLAGGTLTLSATGTATIAVSRLNGDAQHSIAAPVILSSPLRITQDVTSVFSISAGISESAAGMSLAKAGAGPVTFFSGVANTFTGTTTVEEGTLTFQKLAGFSSVGGPLVVGGFGHVAAVMVNGTNQIADTNAVTINAQGTVTLNVTETIGALTINDGTFSLGVNAGTVLVASSLSMTGGTVQMNVASQSLNLTGNVTATSDSNGPALINGGQVGLGGVARSFTVNDGPQAQDLTIAALIFNGGVTKNGTGTLRFAGGSANTYSGTTTVNAGTLELAKTVGVQALNGPLTIGDGSGGTDADVVRIINGDTIPNNVAVTVNASGLLDTNGQFEAVGTLNIVGGHATTGIGGANLNVLTALTLNAGRLTAGAGSQVLLPGTITIGTNGQSLIDGTGSVGMSAGALSFGVNNGAADVDLLVTIPITGANGVIKTGVGTMQLDAVNTYAGDTLVFGQLIVNGSIGNVLFGSSQTTLAGTGTVGNIALGAGALRPGTSPGILHTGNIGGGNGDTFYFEIDGAKPGNGAGFHDQLAVMGTVDLTNVNANFTITAGFALGDQYTLITNDGSDAVVGNFNGMPEGTVTTIGARRYIITYHGGDGNDVVLTPEQAFVIEGDFTPGADDYFVIQRDATDPKLVHVTDYVSFIIPKTYDVPLNQFSNIVIHGGEGDDSIYFEAKNGFFTSSFANVIDALIFVGGGGSNGVTLADFSGTQLDNATFSNFGQPGQGAVSISNGFRVSFDDVGYYADELKVTDYDVTGRFGAADSFSFGPGLGAYSQVGIAGLLSAFVRNKTNVRLEGNGGADTFDIGSAGLVPPAAIAIDAGTDAQNTLNIAGTSGDDTFTLSTASSTAGSIVRPGQPGISYSGTLRLAFDGGPGADTFALPATNFDARITGGPGADTLTFAGSAAGVALNLDAPGVAQAFNASGAVLTFGDAFENVIGSDGADFFFAKPSLLARTLSGGAGGDVLVFDASGANAAKSGSTIVTPGFGTLSTSGIESTTLLNVPAKPVLGAQGNTFAAPLDFAAGKGAVSVAVGDLNGDGRADFVTADSKGNTVSIALSTTTGLLLPAVQKATGGVKPTSVVLADFDGVNGLDIAVTNATSGTVGILLNDGAGNFGTATTLAIGKMPSVLRAGDLDGDGDTDLVAIVGGKNIAIVKNMGGGTFAPATTIPSGALLAKDLSLADLDGDTDLDLVVLHAGGQLATRLNDGTAPFATPTLAKAGAGASALAIADFNGDGKLDVAVTHSSVSRFVSVLLGTGSGAFAPMLRVAYPLAAKASAVVASDFDGDGLADLAIANGVGGRVSILRGLGSGGFVRALDFALDDAPPRRLGALALGDFDGDGRADLTALGTASSEVSVLLRA